MNIGKTYGLVFAFFFTFSLCGWSQEIIRPEGNNISITYAISEQIIETGNPITITRTITNNEFFPLVNLYLSENLSPEMEMDSYSMNIDGIEIPFSCIGPLEDEIVTGYHGFYWLIDEPTTGDLLNLQLMPGETLNLEYNLTSLVSGSYSLILHTTCFYGNGTGFFALGDSISIAFVSDTTCGDIDSDQKIDILDVIYLINFRYKDGPSPESLESCDVNNDNNIDILDVVYLVNFIYKSGPELSCPKLGSL